jgi:hypothetical protein
MVCDLPLFLGFKSPVMYGRATLKYFLKSSRIEGPHATADLNILVFVFCFVFQWLADADCSGRETAGKVRNSPD